jgi:hypothetical protein
MMNRRDPTRCAFVPRLLPSNFASDEAGRKGLSGLPTRHGSVAHGRVERVCLVYVIWYTSCFILLLPPIHSLPRHLTFRALNLWPVLPPHLPETCFT